MKEKRQRCLFLVALGLVLVLTAVMLLVKSCNQQNAGAETLYLPRAGRLIGISLPEETDAWTRDGALLQKTLTALGYRVNLTYGDGTPQTQNAQLADMITEGADCLVVAPTDSTALRVSGEAAKEKGIPLVSYDTLLMDTLGISGFVGFDYLEMGKAVGQYVVNRLQLDTAEKTPSLELLMGAPEDYNALLFHEGIVSVLAPYWDNGSLETPSRRLAFEDTCLSADSQELGAQVTLSRFAKHYPDSPPDVILCGSDTIAAGVLDALASRNYPGDTRPIVTGLGATSQGLQNLANDAQQVTVEPKRADLAKKCSGMIDYLLFGAQPAWTMGSVSNHAQEIPSAPCAFQLIDITNLPS